MQTKPCRDPGPPLAGAHRVWTAPTASDDADGLDDDAAAPASTDSNPPEASADEENWAPAKPRRVEAADEQLAAWIERIADRDERALSALYDATLGRVYGLALRIVRNSGVAEEVVEDTYFQVWRLAPRFDANRGRALTWLLSMTRSRAIDAVRRETRFAAESLDAIDAPAIEDTTQRAIEDLLDDARGHARLRETLLELGAESRQLLALAFYRGLTHEEIAEQVKMPLGTVKSQIRRALLALNRMMETTGPRPLTT